MTTVALVAITERGDPAYILVPADTRPLKAVAALIADMTLLFPSARRLTIAAGLPCRRLSSNPWRSAIGCGQGIPRPARCASNAK